MSDAQFFRKYADIIAEAELPLSEAGFVDAAKGAWNGMKQGWNSTSNTQPAQAASQQKSTGNPEVDKMLATPEAWKLKQQGFSNADIIAQLQQQAKQKAKPPAASAARVPGEVGTKEYYDRKHEKAMAKLKDNHAYQSSMQSDTRQRSKQPQQQGQPQQGQPQQGQPQRGQPQRGQPQQGQPQQGQPQQKQQQQQGQQQARRPQPPGQQPPKDINSAPVKQGFNNNQNISDVEYTMSPRPTAAPMPPQPAAPPMPKMPMIGMK